MAGVPGLEPGPKVLETCMLTIDTIPLQRVESGEWRVTSKNSPLATLHLLTHDLTICFPCAAYDNDSDGKTF